MSTPIFMHPALLDRFGDDEGHGSSSRDDSRPRPRGSYDDAGNYRGENVWRSAQANEAAHPGRRPGGFSGPREGGGFRKPWERRDDRGPGGFSGPREGGGGFRKPWERRDDRGGGFSGPREGGGGFRKPWENRDDRGGGFSGPREGGGFRKPWERRDDRDGDAPREGGSFRKPWENRGPRFGNDRGDGFRKPWEKRPSSFHHDRPEGEAPAPKGPSAPAVPEGELLFGRQPVREMLRANRRVVKQMIFTDGIKDSEEVLEIKAACEARGIAVQNHTRETLDAWLNGANHQGVMAVCEEYPYAELDEITAAVEAVTGDCIVVVLDHVVDPQNLGSLLRTCETAGVAGVVIPSDRAVGVTPAAVRASAGAAEHLKIARVPNLVSVLEKLKELGAWSTGLEALPESKPYTEVDFKGKVCIVIGSEGHGLSSPVRGKCDNLVKLPMFGKVSSLNAGVAGALALYEAIRQQHA